MRTIKTFILAHKVATALICLLLIGGSYWGYKKLTDTSGEMRYVTENVQKGTVIASVTGTGQISASNQINLTPKAAGTVISVPVVAGQNVSAGQLIAQLDTTDAQKAVRDAQVNLASAKLALDKLKKPADQLTLLQAQNALIQANEAKQNAQDDLKKAYDDGFNTIANAFLDLPTIMTGLDDIFYGNAFDHSMDNVTWYVNQTSMQVTGERDKALQYKNDVYSEYTASRAAYDKNFADYKAASRTSDTQTIEDLINETYETTRTVADTVKTGNNLIDFVKDSITQRNGNIPAVVGTQQATLNTYTGTTNTHLSNLLSIKQTIQSDKDTIIGSDRTIAEKTQSIADLKAGADPLDIQSAELTVKQRENALLDAQQTLADYSIRAPFSGTIATLSINPANTVSSGTNVATLITQQKVAEISLNEVDAAKVKQDDKATLTFDAIDGLEITGKVVEIDTVGTVTQGVVTYTVKINLDMQDDRIKPGMSTSSTMITDSKLDVLVVPNSAIKTQGTTSYVEVFDPALPESTSTQGIASTAAPQRKTIVVGLSNDTESEVMTGLNEGDQIVTKTITGTSQTTTTQAPSLFGTGGGNRGGAGGAIRRATGD